MTLLNTADEVRERPRGVEAIAGLAALVGVVALAISALTFLGALPLAHGAFLVGGEMETLGPVLFLLVSLVHFAAAIGLWKLKNWARHLAVGLALIGLIQVTPAISSAVADGRIVAIAREGAQIIVRVMVMWYLMQQPVRDQFD